MTASTTDRRVTWCPADDERLRDLWAAGLGARAIAEALGRTRGAVTGRRAALELPRRKPPRWTAAEETRLAELVERHYPYRRIARKLGRTEAAVTLRLKRAGLDGLRLANGRTLRQVAVLLGIPCSKVISWWVRNGWLRAHPSGLPKIRVVEQDDIDRFLDDEDLWHLWEPDRIPDPRLRRHYLEERRGLRFLTVGEAGDRLGIGIGAVNRRIHEGRLRAVRRGRSNWLIRSDWLTYEIKSLKGVPRRPFTPEQADFIDRHAGAHTIAWIAQQLGRHRDAIARYIRANGLPRLDLTPYVDPLPQGTAAALVGAILGGVA